MALKKSILGAMLLSALAFCAFGASSASASTLHECVQEKQAAPTNQPFTDSTCQTASTEGTWFTKPILANTKIELEPTLTKTLGGGTGGAGEEEGEHAVMHGTVGGVEYRITCKKLSSPNSVAENKEVGGKMVVEGTGKSRFEECSMPKPTQCTVPATIETEELTQTIVDVSETEHFVKFAPVVAPKFVTFTISNAAGKTCPEALRGAKTAEGSVRARVDSPDKRMLTFDSTSGSELKFGGQPALFTATIHFKTKGGTGQTVAWETP